MCAAPEGPFRQKGSDPFARPVRGFRPGFTLIEIMVVIGIILVLVALALPTAFSVLNDSRVKQTKATMSVLESAIEQFVTETPFKPCGAPMRILPFTFPTTAMPGTRLTELFLNLPPSPTTAFAPNPLALDTYTHNPLVTFMEPATKDTDAETTDKFVRLLNVMRQPTNMASFASTAQWRIQPAGAGAYSSIECLWFALKVCSTNSEKVLNQLPPSAVANQNKNFAYFDADGSGAYNAASDDKPGRHPVDLMEVLDAWKHPLRYSIREALYDSTNAKCSNCFNQGCSVMNLRWELRSAGEDGEFSAPFTDPGKGDDVVLQGP